MTVVDIRHIYTPPFEHKNGYIFDANGNMVADEGGTRVRGWGRLGAMENGEQIQDAVGDRIANLLTQHWNDE